MIKFLKGSNCPYDHDFQVSKLKDGTFILFITSRSIDVGLAGGRESFSFKDSEMGKLLDFIRYVFDSKVTPSREDIILHYKDIK